MEGLPSTPWTVFLYALLTAVATGLGALPFLFTRGITPRHLGLANAAAAGLMVAASFGLIYEGVNYSLGRTLVGVGLGLALRMGLFCRRFGCCGCCGGCCCCCCGCCCCARKCACDAAPSAIKTIETKIETRFKRDSSKASSAGAGARSLERNLDWLIRN